MSFGVGVLSFHFAAGRFADWWRIDEASNEDSSHAREGGADVSLQPVVCRCMACRRGLQVKTLKFAVQKYGVGALQNKYA